MATSKTTCSRYIWWFCNVCVVVAFFSLLVRSFIWLEWNTWIAQTYSTSTTATTTTKTTMLNEKPKLTWYILIVACIISNSKNDKWDMNQSNEDEKKKERRKKNAEMNTMCDLIHTIYSQYEMIKKEEHRRSYWLLVNEQWTQNNRKNDK